MDGMNRRTWLAATGGTALGALLPGARAPIPIGQIGTKHGHAAGKVRTIRALAEDWKLVGVVEPDAARRKAVADHPAYRGVRWMTEEELLETKGLRAVAVETDIPDLVPAAARCIAAGLHVHLDKPAGEDLSGIRAAWTDARRKGVVIQMGYMYRTNPAMRFCFDVVRRGWLGKVFEVDAVISKTVGEAARRQLARYSGGTMFELGCHVIDAVVTVLGPPEKVTPFLRRTRDDGLADNTLAVLEYASATATVRSAVIEVDGVKRRQFVVCGDQGTVEIRPIEPPRLRLTLDRARGEYAKGTQEVELPTMKGRYDGDFKEFAAIIRGERNLRWGMEHDLAVQETVLRASGMPVR